nr:RNA-dependent RNA polymerase [Erysiphe necator associated partitivirus 12]
MQPTTNLKVIGHLPKNTKVFAFHQGRQDALRNMSEKLVKKAIHMECTPELAHKAIHGFRRSAGGDEIAEKDFLKSDQPYHPVPRDHHYKKALATCERLFRPSRRLKPIAYPDLRYFPWTLNVSAEAPYSYSQYWARELRRMQAEGITLDSKPTFHNLYDEIFHDNRSHIHTIKFGLAPFWDKETGKPVPYKWNTLHARSHTVKADKDDKIRAVFGVPKLLLMAENMFVWNLQKEYLNKRVQSPMLWGYETFKGGWQKLWRDLYKTNFNSVLSADWSGFDHNALHEVIDDVHSMWRSWFDFDQGYEPSRSDTHDYHASKTEEWKIENLWTWMTHSIKHTPILGFSGTIYEWSYNGIASGFQQTQLLDSFVNAIYLLTCLSACGIDIDAPGFNLFVQGDDSLTTFSERVFQFGGKEFLAKLAREANIRFNAVLSVDKTTHGTSLNDVEVLSYRNNQGIALRDPAELLAKLLYPERPKRLGGTAASAIGIAMAAMGSSPQVYNTCRNVYNFIVYELEVEVDFKEFRAYSTVHQSAAEEALALQPTRFPSYNETLCYNYDFSTRSEKEKQRLWPTKPTGNGFHFLVN